MNIIIPLLIVFFLGVIAYYLRQHVNTTINYKEARSKEIKRRLQVEHKQEQALNEILKRPMDDNDRFKIITRFAHERHQRTIHYVIEDMFERYQ